MRSLLQKLEIRALLYFRKATNKANKNAVDLIIYNKKFALFLSELGLPVGKKGQIQIPNWIMALPLEKKRYVIRGIFDTDGSMSARKSEKYRRPFMLIDSGSEPLRKQLKSILRKMGFPAYDSSGTVGVIGIQHAKRWFSVIGSSNQRHLGRYLEWLKTGTLPMLNIKAVMLYKFYKGP